MVETFTSVIAEYLKVQKTDPLDNLHLQRWLKHIDECDQKTQKLWNEHVGDAPSIIAAALESRRVANAAQSNVNLVKIDSERRSALYLDMAKNSQELFDFYSAQPKHDLFLWSSIYKELGDIEGLIDRHGREARLLRMLAPPADDFKISKRGNGAVDRRSRERKAFLSRMEGWWRAIYSSQGQLRDPLTNDEDDLLANIASIALDRSANPITREDVKIARLPTTRAGRHRL